MDPAPAITDLLLGSTILACAGLLLRVPALDRAWHLTFWFAGASALAGALHHGLFHAEASWTAVGVLIVIALSYLLAASSRQVLGRRGTRIVLGVRTAGLLAYAVAIAAGEADLAVLLVAESLTMASILALWIHAAHQRHPMARSMIVAIGANGLAGIVFALPDSATAASGLDATSLSHLAQIPGFLLLYRAVARGGQAGKLHETS
ncbi:hypothetical protein GCM10027174_43410 [Salinifilum aidingensis]